MRPLVSRSAPLPAGWLAKLSKQTGLSKFHLVLALSLLFCAVFLLGFGMSLFTNVVGFIYPAYASFKAIESDEKDDDTQWLTYWVVYAAFTICESFADVILSYMPFYYAFKFGFLLWCMLPATNGAKIVYTQLLAPFLKKHEARVDSHIAGGLAAANEAAGDIAATGAAAIKSGANAAINSGLASKIISSASGSTDTAKED